MPAIHIQMLPQFLTGHLLDDATAVVIDVLRASTTMIHALSHGARAVIPCLTIESALEAAQRFPADSRILGGERGGTLIPGFDLGNSPFDYTPQRVQGKTVIFTTTNGTRALLKCRDAAQVLIGAFANRQAVARMLSERQQEIHLVCAGTNDQLTAEDILFAGAVANDLLSRPDSVWSSAGLQTQMAVDFYQARSRSREQFREAFFGSRGAQNLIELGMTPDVERSLEQDLFSGVPRWNAETNEITLA